MAQKKWYETALGKAYSYTSPIGLAALGISKHTEKVKAARAGTEEQIKSLREMELPQETMDAYQRAMEASRQGLSQEAINRATQQQARLQSGAFAGLRDRRSALAAAPSMAQSNIDFSSRLAELDERRRMENLRMGVQAGMNIGQQKLGLQQYKIQGLYNYFTGRQRQLNQNLTNLLSGAARIGSMFINPVGGAQQPQGN